MFHCFSLPITRGILPFEIRQKMPCASDKKYEEEEIRYNVEEIRYNVEEIRYNQ